jgi:hypothetical protein
MNRLPILGILFVAAAGCSVATTGGQQTPPGPTPSTSTQQTASTTPTKENSEMAETDVRGVVKLDGKPLSGAVIFFLSSDGKSAGAISDAEGRYKLPSMRPGLHKATVELKFEGDPKRKGIEIPNRFANPETSGLEFELKSGPNTLDIELKSK